MSKQVKAKKTIYILLFMLLAAVNVILAGRKVLAASAAMNLTLSEENIIQDSTFSVVVTVEASEDIGDFECFLSFDSGMIEFVSGGAFVNGGDGVVMISDKDSKEKSGNKKYSMKFKAINHGETNLWFEDDVIISCALDGAGMSLSRNQLMFEIKDPEQISDDTSLSELSISEGILSPVFKQGTKTYKAEVSSFVSQIAVNASAADEKASISIKGNTNLKPGKNTILITVTAPSGDQDVTKIIVTKEKEVTEPETKDAEKENISPAGVKAIEDEKGMRFLTEEIRLQVLSPEDESLIPKDYIKTTIVMDGLPITVYTWKFDLDSDLLLVYGMNQDGESGFYQYSRKNNSLEKYTGESPDEPQKEKNKIENPETQTSKEKLQTTVIIGVLGLLCVCLSIALMLQFIKKPKKISETEEREDDFFL